MSGQGFAHLGSRWQGPQCAAETALRPKRGFTLVELLVVIAIISVLAALLMPALEEALAEARVAACISQQNQMYLATFGYAEDHEMVLPLGNGHAGWSPGHTMTGYFCSGPTGTDWAGRTFDGPPARHVFRGLAALWALDYFGDRYLLIDPDWHNDLESSNIVYQGTEDWSKFEPRYADPMKARGWSYGTYVFFTYTGRNGIGGNGKGDPRRLDRPVYHGSNIGTTALTMCRMGKYSQSQLGCHDREAMAVTYEDGHIRTFRTIQEHYIDIKLYGPYTSRKDIGNDAYYIDNPKTTWWRWVHEEDRK